MLQRFFKDISSSWTDSNRTHRVGSYDSELSFMSICSIRIRSRKWYIFENLLTFEFSSGQHKTNHGTSDAFFLSGRHGRADYLWDAVKWVKTILFQSTDGLELSCCVFSKISHFLEGILMEHIDMKNRLDSKLHVSSMFSIRIRSRKWDIFDKP